MSRMPISGLAALFLVTACGPAGTISGRVAVEGGSAANLAVVLFGPVSAAAVTRDDGAFSFTGLPDGAYVVRATVRGAEVEEQNAAVTVANGVGAPEPQLSFRIANARVTGKVVFSDGSSAQGVPVSAIGPMTRAAVTGGDGSFSLEGLRAGAYLVTAEARDTREGRVSVSVEASGTRDVGELVFTPVGRLSGTVTSGGAAVAGVSVSVPGTPASVVTDAAGAFELLNVPTGAQTVLATIGSTPFVRAATQAVTVLRGENAPLSLELAEVPPPTGTVTGVITFNGDRSPRDITVSVAGLPVTANPQANGQFSLTLPVGTWSVMASASHYPRQLIARVEVLAGQTIALPGTELSWFRPIWRASSPLTLVTVGSSSDAQPWSLVRVTELADKLALLNTQTGEFRVLAMGVTTGRFSSRARYVVWSILGTAYVYEIASGRTQAFGISMLSAANPTVLDVDVSSDESVLFVHRSNNTLERIPLATPANAAVFPAVGGATQILRQGVDRWFIREGPDVRLVTPTSDVARIFANVTTLSVAPTAWALTDCAGSCQLRVLAATGTGMPVVVSGVSPSIGDLVAFTGGARESRPDYPCFLQPLSSAAFCVRAADGTRYPLPTVPSAFLLNEAGDRFVMTYNAMGGAAVFEGAMPPPGVISPTGLSSVGWTVDWVSPTRVIAVENPGAAPRRLLDVKNGMLTLDADLGTQAVSVRGPLVVYPRASTARWRAFVGDGASRELPVATSRSVSTLAARSFFGGAPAPRYGSVSFDNTSSWIIDEQSMSVSQLFVGRGVGAFRSGAVEVLFVSRPGTPVAYLVLGSNTLIEDSEGDVSTAGYLASTGQLLGAVGLAADQQTLMLGTFSP